MGAHSTFEDHLKGVQAFHAPPSDDELNGRHSKSSKSLKTSKSSKHKDSGKHKKDKRKNKEKERVKEKKSKHKKEKGKRDESDSEDNSPEDDVETQLEKGRAAVRITREILEKQYSLKQELRQVQKSPMRAIL